MIIMTIIWITMIIMIGKIWIHPIYQIHQI
jgi:hypothetical protein